MYIVNKNSFHIPESFKANVHYQFFDCEIIVVNTQHANKHSNAILYRNKSFTNALKYFCYNNTLQPYILCGELN